MLSFSSQVRTNEGCLLNSPDMLLRLRRRFLHGRGCLTLRTGCIRPSTSGPCLSRILLPEAASGLPVFRLSRWGRRRRRRHRHDTPMCICAPSRRPLVYFSDALRLISASLSARVSTPPVRLFVILN